MQITITKKETVTLSPKQISDATRIKLQRMLGGTGIADHDNERWVYRWHNTGHGSGDTDYIRKATPLDEALVLVLAAV